MRRAMRLGVATALALVAPPMTKPLRVTSYRMNIFENAKQVVDGVKDAYQDDDFVPDGFVKASHILFLMAEGDAENKAAALKKHIDDGEIAFGEAALAFSNCPTRDLNGQLGIFQSLSRLTEGTLNDESGMPYDGEDTYAFDALLFSADLGVVHQIKTQWGWHLVLISERGQGAPVDLLTAARERGVSKAADLIKQAMTSSPTEGQAPTGGFGGGATSKSKPKGKKKSKKR